MAVVRVGYDAWQFTSESELSDLPFKEYKYELIPNEPFQFSVSYDKYYVKENDEYVLNDNPIWDDTKEYYVKYLDNDIPYGSNATLVDGNAMKLYQYTADSSLGTNGWVELK